MSSLALARALFDAGRMTEPWARNCNRTNRLRTPGRPRNRLYFTLTENTNLQLNTDTTILQRHRLCQSAGNGSRVLTYSGDRDSGSSLGRG